MRKKLMLALAIVALGAIAFTATSLASDRPARGPKITKIVATSQAAGRREPARGRRGRRRR